MGGQVGGGDKQFLCAAERLHVLIELGLHLGVVVHGAQAVDHVLGVHLALVVRVLVVEHLLTHRIQLHPVAAPSHHQQQQQQQQHQERRSRKQPGCRTCPWQPQTWSACAATR